MCYYISKPFEDYITLAKKLIKLKKLKKKYLKKPNHEKKLIKILKKQTGLISVL
jgi:hypothetical protein